jgi:hypothetical protein
LGRPDFINAAQLVLKEDAVLQNVEHSRFDLTISVVEQIAQKTRHREEVYLVWSCFVLQHAPTNHFTKAFAIGAEKVSQLQVEMSSDVRAFYFTYPNFSSA